MDQEEENEEAGDMNDNEFNEMLTCSNKEAEIFCAMDIVRECDALETWHAAGNHGWPPLPLMQLEEFLRCYQTDEPFEAREMDEVMEGWGQQ